MRLRSPLVLGLFLATFAAADQPKKLPELVKDLGDGKVEVRVAAAKALAELGQDAKAAIPALVKALKDSEANVRAPPCSRFSKWATKPGTRCRPSSRR